MNASSVFILETLKSTKGLRSTAEKAMAQIGDGEMHYAPDDESNSVAVMMQHMAGNMLSRFTNFLTEDGEKPWRKRDAEFMDDDQTRDQLMEAWNKGWDCLIGVLESLREEDLLKVITIRGEEHTVIRALQRQLAHYAYHTGQIVYLCKLIRKSNFKSLSIPRGQSETYKPGQ